MAICNESNERSELVGKVLRQNRNRLIEKNKTDNGVSWLLWYKMRMEKKMRRKRNWNWLGNKEGKDGKRNYMFPFDLLLHLQITVTYIYTFMDSKFKGDIN